MSNFLNFLANFVSLNFPTSHGPLYGRQSRRGHQRLAGAAARNRDLPGEADFSPPNQLFDLLLSRIRNCGNSAGAALRQEESDDFIAVLVDLGGCEHTLQAVFGVAYENIRGFVSFFLGAISKIGSRVDFRVCRECNSVLRLPAH